MSKLAHGQLVLIIEDNEKNLKLARDLLRYHGFHTIEAPDAETGLRMASDSKPNIILMDIELPGMDGVTALERLRADPASPASLWWPSLRRSCRSTGTGSLGPASPGSS
jgi:CheY-like chemotaxis protein